MAHRSAEGTKDALGGEDDLLVAPDRADWLREPSPLVRRVAERLLQRGETIAFAESCTGGRVSAMLAVYPGISSSYRGSIVAYANDIKSTFLGVPEQLLKSVGAVSAPVARAMANGVADRLGADWAVSVTGVAGPGGGSVEKPVGTVFFGICGPGVEETEKCSLTGERGEIQEAAAEYALTLLLRSLERR